MLRIKSVPLILVDRREQLPYSFSDYNIQTLPYTLDTGDYSVAVQLTGNDRKKLIDFINKKYEEIPISSITIVDNNAFIGFDSKISIERKTLENWTSDIAENRDRVENSIKRGSLLKYYAVFIESSETEVIAHKYTSQILPQSVLNTAIRWSVKYRVPIVFCDNRISAEYHTYHALMGFLEYKKKGII